MDTSSETTASENLPPHLLTFLRGSGFQGEPLVTAQTDMDIHGGYAERWVLASAQEIRVVAPGTSEEPPTCVRKVALTDAVSARVDSRVGSGFLEVKTPENWKAQMVSPTAEGTFRLWEADLVDVQKPWRHDPRKLARSIIDIHSDHQVEKVRRGRTWPDRMA